MRGWHHITEVPVVVIAVSLLLAAASRRGRSWYQGRLLSNADLGSNCRATGLS